MSKMRLGLVFIVTFFSLSVARAFFSKTTNPFSLSVPTQKILIDSIQELFAENFEEADKLLKKVDSSKTEHPIIALVGVVRYWWEMSSEILEVREDASKPFLAAADSCLEISKKRLDQGNDSGESYLSMAVTLGLMSRYSAANHAWLAAYSRGSKAADYAKMALRENSALKDAYLPLGTFNYAKALIQGSVANEGGSTDDDNDDSNGLKQLRGAYEDGVYFNQASGLLLGGIMLDDNPKKAVKLLAELKKDIPCSGFVNVVYVTALYNAGYDTQLKSESDLFFEKVNKGFFPRKYLPQAYFLKGQVSFKQKNWQEAKENFEQAIQSGTPDNAYVTWSHLYRGYTLDLLSEREDAKREYEEVLKLERRFSSHDHARARLDRPFKETDAEVTKILL